MPEGKIYKPKARTHGGTAWKDMPREKDLYSDASYFFGNLPGLSNRAPEEDVQGDINAIDALTSSGE